MGFGHRSNSKLGDNGAGPPPGGGDRPPQDHSLPVIVRRSEASPGPNEYGEHYIVEAVSSFVEHATERAGYAWSEIPAAAVEVNYLFDYIGQVENGGHSQFIGNRAREFGECVLQAAAGLRAIDAGGYLAILSQLADWISENPEEAARQTGFAGGRAAFLDGLDEQFRALWKSDPLDARLAAWIASWPNLQIVEDADYDLAIRRLAVANPANGHRLATERATLIARAVAAAGITDPKQIERTAAAIDLLLEKAGFENAAIDLQPDGEPVEGAPREVRWIVFCDLKPHLAVTGDVAVLVPVGENDAVATATREEIEAHWHKRKTSDHG